MKTLFWMIAFAGSFHPIAKADFTPKIGDSPKLIVKCLDDKIFDLSTEHGKWVIIHFFATWCPGCKTELPELMDLYKKYHSKKLDVFALSPEPSRRKKDVQDFLKNYSFPAGLIADTRTNDFDANVALPTSFLIDPDGKVKLIFIPKEHEFDPKEVEAFLR